MSPSSFLHSLLAILLLISLASAAPPQRNCQKALAIFVFSICGDTCQGPRAADVAQLACSEGPKMDADHLKMMCCPNL